MVSLFRMWWKSKDCRRKGEGGWESWGEKWHNTWKCEGEIGRKKKVGGRKRKYEKIKK